MLVLKRNVGQKIVIDDRITIVVVEIRNDTVRLGIDAPRDIAIVRDDAKRKTLREDDDSRLPAE